MSPYDLASIEDDRRVYSGLPPGNLLSPDGDAVAETSLPNRDGKPQASSLGQAFRRSVVEAKLSPADDAARLILRRVARWIEFGITSSHVAADLPVTIVGDKRSESAYFPQELPSWLLGFYREPKTKAPRSAIVRLLYEVSELLQRRDFDEIDRLLSTVAFDRLAPELVMGLVRSSAVARTRLPSWRNAVFRAATELKARGLPADQILIGLADDLRG